MEAVDRDGGRDRRVLRDNGHTIDQHMARRRQAARDASRLGGHSADGANHPIVRLIGLSRLAATCET
jgi:hypothetical protein